MKRNFIILHICCCLILFFSVQSINAQLSIDKKITASKSPLIVAHRGDWRNTPENSIKALRNCIVMGIDVMELDIARTKDSQLIILHDRTLDRTTTGKGSPADYTLKDLNLFFLKNATGHATKHKISTLEEMLDSAKGKIILDLDKCFPYLDQTVKLVRKKNMIGQVIFNIKNELPYDSLCSHYPDLITPDMYIMPIVFDNTINADTIIKSYRSHRRTIVQMIFERDDWNLLDSISSIKKKYGFHIWMNSLWPEQNGKHDDDRAVEEGSPNQTWGWLLHKGADLIQTDRPLELIQYIHSRY